MEGYVFEWINFIKGWRPRYLKCENNYISLSHQKGDIKKKQIELSEDSKIFDDKNKKFSVDIGKLKIYFKAKTPEEKNLWIEAIKLTITNMSIFNKNNKIAQPVILNNVLNVDINNKNETNLNLLKDDKDLNIENKEKNQLNENKIDLIENKGNQCNFNKIPNNLNFENENTKNFSKCYKNYQEILENEYNKSNKNNLDNVIYSLKNIQNLFFEFNNNIDNFNQYIQTNNKSKDVELKIIFNSFYNLKSEIKVNLIFIIFH